MEESPGAHVKVEFKCCSMCTIRCFETHQDFGRSEAEKLFLAPSFSSVIKCSDTTGVEFLRIPIVFAENQNFDKVGDKLQLEGPGGFESICTKQRVQKDCVLYTGFERFAKHHSVEAGDLLVFYLVAKSHFLVKVYDKFGIDKVFLLKNPTTSHKSDPKWGSSSKQYRHVEDELEDRDEEGVNKGSDEEGVDEGSIEDAADRLVKSRGKKLCKELEVNTREETKGGSRYNPPEHSLARQEAEMAPLYENLTADRNQHCGHKRKFSAMSDRWEENARAIARQVNFLRTGTGEKKEAAERQIDAANTLMEKLIYPSKLVFLKHNHVNENRTVYLSNLPLPKQSTVVTLVDEAHEPYTVRWLVQGKRSRLALGWDQFVSDHNLEVEDACVFAVTDDEVVSVYIFRLDVFLNPTDENQQPEQDHRDDLQPSGSALGQSSSEN